jgi:hypothetical protein
MCCRCFVSHKKDFRDLLIFGLGVEVHTVNYLWDFELLLSLRLLIVNLDHLLLLGFPLQLGLCLFVAN